MRIHTQVHAVVGRHGAYPRLAGCFTVPRSRLSLSLPLFADSNPSAIPRACLVKVSARCTRINANFGDCTRERKETTSRKGEGELVQHAATRLNINPSFPSINSMCAVATTFGLDDSVRRIRLEGSQTLLAIAAKGVRHQRNRCRDYIFRKYYSRDISSFVAIRFPSALLIKKLFRFFVHFSMGSVTRRSASRHVDIFRCPIIIRNSENACETLCVN